MIMECRITLAAYEYGFRQVGNFMFSPPVTAAKFIIKSSLFIQLLGVIRQPEQMLNTEPMLIIFSSAHHIAKRNVG